MMMSWIYTLLLFTALISAMLTGQEQALSAAIPEGAASGITLAISLAGSICLWSGVGRLMESAGLTGLLSRMLRPLLHRIFPESRTDSNLAQDLSANICANLLGLGNAATPMGIRAAKRLVSPTHPSLATDSLCRLVILNTASIQLIPGTVAAIRAGLGCQTPFDILPAVWLTSFASAAFGLIVARGMERVWKRA